MRNARNHSYMSNLHKIHIITVFQSYFIVCATWIFEDHYLKFTECVKNLTFTLHVHLGTYYRHLNINLNCQQLNCYKANSIFTAIYYAWNSNTILEISCFDFNTGWVFFWQIKVSIQYIEKWINNWLTAFIIKISETLNLLHQYNYLCIQLIL